MKKTFVFTVVSMLIIVVATTAAVVSFSIFMVPSTVMGEEEQQGTSYYYSTVSSSLQDATPSTTPTLKSIFKQVENSTVQITSKIPIPSTNPSNSPAQNATALGSGFVYDKQGHIITNNHVVGNAKIVDVTFVDGNRYTAKVIGTDINSDIAVIQIQNITKQRLSPSLLLKPLVIGNSSKLEVGDPVIAIGNPFGLSDTLTTGIVSGVGRLLPSAAASGFSIPNAIQTDAPINPGNSGGPLLNSQGQVIGMNTAIISDTSGFSGLGFAVPSNTIAKVVPILLEKGTYPHPYLGAKIATLTSDILQNVTRGLSASAARTTLSNLKGAYVDTITKNGPADKAGIHGSTTDQYSQKQIGDIITAVDKHPIVRSDDLISYIDQHKSVGDIVTLTVYRNGHTLDLKATLIARPSPLPFLPTQLAPSSPLPHPPTQPPRIPTPPHP
ncbi:MAG TPA: trypsin-like peptidase domain-containing protein [Nitrososphaeraceae archaeon]|nr:trypsin-like peptidase domain-containing protein [Nitrososphaeraceae archaeon]